MDDKEVGAPCGRKEMTEQGMPLVNPHALIPAGWLPQSQQLLVLAPVRSHQSLQVMSCLSGSSEDGTSRKEHCRVVKGKIVIGRDGFGADGKRPGCDQT